jgi:Flp pilus assembly protein TadG
MLDPMPNCDGATMRKNWTKNAEKGQALLEFAAVTLVFFTLAFGIIEFGRALWTWNTIVQATRAGARYATVATPTSNDSEIKKMVVYNDPNAGAGSTPVVPGLSETNVTVSYLMYNPPGTVATNKAAADLIEVSITGYQFNFLVSLFGSQITLPAFKTTLPLEGLGAS